MANSDAYLTANASTTNEEYDYMKISLKEEDINVGYQEGLEIYFKMSTKT